MSLGYSTCSFVVYIEWKKKIDILSVMNRMNLSFLYIYRKPLRNMKKSGLTVG